MTYIDRGFIVFVALVLAGCAAPLPIISDINDSAVHVQARVDVPQHQLDAKAAEGCAVYGKKPTDALSEKRFGEWNATREVLYACQ